MSHSPFASVPGADAFTAEAHRTPSPFVVLSWDGVRPSIRGSAICTLGERSPVEDGQPAIGAFAMWRWNGRRLEVRTDRLGFRPLFYAVDGSTLWLSPSIPELMRQGAPSAVDDAALAVFLRLGTFIGDDTPFLHVRAVPPNARLTWEDGRFQLEGSRVHRPRLDIRRDAAIARYGELFRAAMAKHPVAPERTIVPLSGGRDSRHILLELHAAGRAPASCVTVRPAPPKSNEDVVVAATVANALGVPHVVLETTPDRCGDEIEKNLRTSLCVFEHFWVMPLVRHVEGRDLVIYDGIGGDTLSEAKYMSAERLALIRGGDLHRYADEELMAEAYLPALLRPEVYRRFSRGLAIERLVAELETHVDAPNPLGSYRFWNRTRRTVALAPFSLLAGVAAVRAPFLDDDLYDFLASLPAELLVSRNFHSDTIGRSYPRFAHLRYEDSAAPHRPASAHARQFGFAALLKELWVGLRKPRARTQPLLRHGAYASRLAAMLVAPRRALNAKGVAELGIYLSQVEDVADRQAV